MRPVMAISARVRYSSGSLLIGHHHWTSHLILLINSPENHTLITVFRSQIPAISGVLAKVKQRL